MVREEFGYHPEDAFKKEAWERWHELLGQTHEYMKNQFDRHTDVLTELLRSKDTTQCWIVWSDMVKRSFATGLGIVDDFCLGHGIFTTTEKTMHTPRLTTSHEPFNPTQQMANASGCLNKPAGLTKLRVC